MRRLFLMLLALSSFASPQLSTYINCSFEDGSLCGGAAYEAWSIGQTLSNIAITSNVLTVNSNNSGGTYHVGDHVAFNAATNNAFLKGTGCNIGTISGTQFTCPYSHSDVASVAEIGYTTLNKGQCDPADTNCNQWLCTNTVGAAHGGTHYADCMDTFGQNASNTIAGVSWKTIVRWTFGTGNSWPYQPETDPGVFYLRYWQKFDAAWIACMNIHAAANEQGAFGTQTKLALTRDGNNFGGTLQPTIGIDQCGTGGQYFNFQSDNGDIGATVNCLFPMTADTWYGFTYQFSRDTPTGTTTLSAWYNTGTGWVPYFTNKRTGGGVEATATATVSGGQLTSLLPNNLGRGYYSSNNAPAAAVSFTGGNCSVAPTATATASAGGQVTSYSITGAGSGCDASLTPVVVGYLSDGSAFTTGSPNNGMLLDIGAPTVQPPSACTQGNVHTGIDDVYASSIRPADLPGVIVSHGLTIGHGVSWQ